MEKKSPLHQLVALDNDARAFGFDWPDQHMILDQVVSECEEVREELSRHCEERSDEAISGLLRPSGPCNDKKRARLQEEIGDVLHAAVSLCAYSGFDVDETLQIIVDKFEGRMQALKALTHEQGLSNLQGQPIDTLMDFWQTAKDSLT